MRRDAPGALEARAARPWHAAVRLEIDGLALAAGGRPLLDGLSATLAAGERWVVLGPNGAGKSTLIAALAGLLRPAAGTLRLQSRPLADWPAATLAGWRAWCPASWSDPFPLRVDEALRSVAHAHAPGGDAAGTRLAALLRALGVTVRIPAEHAHAGSLWRLARSDKKVVRGQVLMCVPQPLGTAVDVELTEPALAAALRDA